MNKKYATLVGIAAMAFAACQDDTASLGIFAEQDLLESETKSFNITSRSHLIGTIEASSTKGYLGCVWDPETETEIRAEFIAQFHTFENYTIPSRESLKLDADGHPVADSVEVRLYFTDFYGDADNPMNISVYELDRENVFGEDNIYPSSTDIREYIPDDAKPLARKVFTVEDYTVSESQRTSTSYNKNVRVMLPISYGADILDKALNHPEYFVDSWHFLRSVCPGMAFVLEGGRGTMISLDVSALNVYFNYTKDDSTYVGIARFAATPEVIQLTQINNTGLQRLVDETDKPYTYLKSPAAIATELTLPVDEVFRGHENDSISRARVILQRYNSYEQSPYALGAPSSLLMVLKDSVYSFFAKHKTSDGKIAQTTSFTSSMNVYAFTNIGRLLANMRDIKLSGMQNEGLSEESWMAAHPDWNKVLLVPVSIKTVTNSSSNVVTQVSVVHDYSLTSTRIVGGTLPIEMNVIYSSYK